MTRSDRTSELLRHLASRPGHDEVKADFRDLLIEEFGVALGALEFERRVPEVKGQLDRSSAAPYLRPRETSISNGRTLSVECRIILAHREREEDTRFVGIASDGFKWVVFERAENALVKVKETTLDPEKPDVFLAWLDGAVALKSALPPDPLTIRIELGEDFDCVPASQ